MGHMPDLNENEQVIYPDYNEKYNPKHDLNKPDTTKLREVKGIIKYMLVNRDRPNEFKSFHIKNNEEIRFDVCNGEFNENVGERDHPTELMTKRLFSSYNDGQVRFLSANYIRNLEKEPNLCESSNCSIYAECVVDSESDDGFYCQCKPGFDGDGYDCKDINECDEGPTFCSPIAECNNFLGYYECLCSPPKIGDGRTCNWDTEEKETNGLCKRCDKNADCLKDRCQCRLGFYGDGFKCLVFNESSTIINNFTPQTFTTTQETTTSNFKHFDFFLNINQ